MLEFRLRPYQTLLCNHVGWLFNAQDGGEIRNDRLLKMKKKS